MQSKFKYILLHKYDLIYIKHIKFCAPSFKSNPGYLKFFSCSPEIRDNRRLLYNTIQYNLTQYKYDKVQFAVQYNTIQYNTM